MQHAPLTPCSPLLTRDLPSRNVELWVTQPRLYTQFAMFFSVVAVVVHWLTTPPSAAVVGGDCAGFLAFIYLTFRATIAVKCAAVEWLAGHALAHCSAHLLAQIRVHEARQV